MTKLLPIVLALVGLGSGVGAGFILRPSLDQPDAVHEAAADTRAGEAGEDKAIPVADHANEPVGDGVFVRFQNQFVIPLIANGEVAAMVVMTLNLEVDPGVDARALEREPRLRDRFLRVMLDHAATGGFDGVFTSNGQINRLKTALIETASQEIGAGVRDVLILDMNKQAV
ncbi:flagellar basal body-associated protein FliL [Palleronia sp.]|uniref:flagellar basal body-associated protein FliL n=1 Tax=Palleronia sp. TaxID=1940284 RepID=UPI0035C87373